MRSIQQDEIAVPNGEALFGALFGQAAVAAGIVFIDRDNRKAAFEAYRYAAEDVKRGRSVIICPEGTRGKDYHLRPFKKGPFALALEARLKLFAALSDRLQRGYSALTMQLHRLREILAECIGRKLRNLETSA